MAEAEFGAGTRPVEPVLSDAGKSQVKSLIFWESES